jgi:hypothetical protein
MVMGEKITINMIRTINNFNAIDPTVYNSGQVLADNSAQVAIYATRQIKGE